MANQSTIDLRSDTVTRPTPAMREAMGRADVVTTSTAKTRRSERTGKPRPYPDRGDTRSSMSLLVKRKGTGEASVDRTTIAFPCPTSLPIIDGGRADWALGLRITLGWTSVTLR